MSSLSRSLPFLHQFVVQSICVSNDGQARATRITRSVSSSTASFASLFSSLSTSLLSFTITAYASRTSRSDYRPRESIYKSAYAEPETTSPLAHLTLYLGDIIEVTLLLVGCLFGTFLLIAFLYFLAFEFIEWRPRDSWWKPRGSELQRGEKKQRGR